MLDQLVSQDYVGFTIAFVLMVGLGLIWGMGLEIGWPQPGVPWLKKNGRAQLSWKACGGGGPPLAWLTGFLACFAAIGTGLQQVATLLLGFPLHWSIAVGCAMTGALAANILVSGLLATAMLDYQACIFDDGGVLLRRRATVLEGIGRRGQPARAEVIDDEGHVQFVMVEPNDDDGLVRVGDSGVLIRREGSIFYIVPETRGSLP